MIQRIQRQRTKGYKMPHNTIYCGRPTKWGNPLKLVGGDMIYIHAGYRRKMLEPWVYFKHGNIDDLIKYYALLLNGEYLGENVDMKWWNIKLHELPLYQLKTAENLACFCSLDKPCHVDIIIDRLKVIYSK